MDDDFSMLRGERRSFFCHNKLWAELQKQTGDCISISEYVKRAIIEKLVRDNPDLKDYYGELVFRK